MAATAEKGRIMHRERALEGIIDLAARGEVPIGEQISEAVLSERLGLSRTPIREALAIYANEGVVTQVPQAGTFINRPTLRGVAEALQLRHWMEKVGVRKLTDPDSDHEPDKLRSLGASLPLSVSSLDPYEVLKTDARLHEALTEDADMQQFARWTAIAGVRRRLFHVGHPLRPDDLVVVMDSDVRLIDDLVNAPDATAGQAALERNYADQVAMLEV
ncbi:MAG: GntR family transcriptional regulator [Candidatus Saccharimonadales bacterium]